MRAISRPWSSWTGWGCWTREGALWQDCWGSWWARRQQPPPRRRPRRQAARRAAPAARAPAVRRAPRPLPPPPAPRAARAALRAAEARPSPIRSTPAATRSWTAPSRSRATATTPPGRRETPPVCGTPMTEPTRSAINTAMPPSSPMRTLQKLPDSPARAAPAAGAALPLCQTRLFFRGQPICQAIWSRCIRLSERPPWPRSTAPISRT